MAAGMMTKVYTARTRRRATKVKSNKTAMGIAKQALKLAKQNVSELKYHDVPFDQYANYDPTTAANGGLQSLSLVPANAGAPSATTREGDEIRLVSLQVRAQVEYDYANYPYNVIRVIIIQDYTNFISNIGELLEVGSGVLSVNSPYNYLYHTLNRKFKVLYDQRFDSPIKNGNAVPAASTLTRHNIQITKNLKNIKNKYDPVSATAVTNEIKMFVIGDVAFAFKGGGLSVYGYSRLLFRED